MWSMSHNDGEKAVVRERMPTERPGAIEDVRKRSDGERSSPRSNPKTAAPLRLPQADRSDTWD